MTPPPAPGPGSSLPSPPPAGKREGGGDAEKKIHLRRFFEEQQRLLEKSEQTQQTQERLCEAVEGLVQFLREQKSGKETKNQAVIEAAHHKHEKLELLKEQHGHKAHHRQAQVEHFKDMRAVVHALERAYPAKDLPPAPPTPYDVDDLPRVEVAMKIYKISNVDTSGLTFDVDVIVQLDWRDPKIEEVLQRSPDLDVSTLDWQQTWFNPVIEVDNAKDDAQWLEGFDEIPRVRENREKRYGEREGQVRLGKTMRYRGQLTIDEVELRCFPFDLQLLPLRVKSRRWEVQADPRTKKKVRVPVQLVHGRCRRSDSAYAHARSTQRGDGHMAMPTADGMLEFDFYGICGYQKLLMSEKGDIYEVGCVVMRPTWRNAIFMDFIISNLMVLLCFASFYDTAAPELSSRMSISLTIMLTLSAYTSQRPDAINKAPYSTFHDKNEQKCLLLVLLISVENVVATKLCGGEHEEAPAYMQAYFAKFSKPENLELCFAPGFCQSRNIDCWAMVGIFALWITMILWSLTKVFLLRHKFVEAKVKENITPVSQQRISVGEQLRDLEDEDERRKPEDIYGRVMKRAQTSRRIEQKTHLVTRY